MKSSICLAIVVTALFSCNTPAKPEEQKEQTLPIEGTWKLLSGTLIEKGDTTVTDYTKGSSFIKIINDTHFAFLMHDLRKGKDTAAVFSTGGGAYTLKGNNYTEHLEYCNDRQWEGNDFRFSVTINTDTLIQQGIEKIDSIGV